MARAAEIAYAGAMLENHVQKAETARQWVITTRLLFVVGALAGLVGAMLVRRFL